jgi:hypothetical protein
MAAVSGQGTTFNLPNYHGELFTVTPTETPFLSAIGGLGGAKTAHAIDFEWQTIDRRSSTANNAALEGAAAPTAGERSRTQVKNCVEIHHSAIEISYSKMGATQNYAGVNVGPQWDDFMVNELALQTQAELESIAVDVEKSFLSGTYARPANNSTVRTTQGVLGAAGTVSANAGTNRALTSDILNAHIQAMFDAGAKLPETSTVFIVGSSQNTNLTKVYAAASTLSAPVRDRNVAGMNINTVVTPFGTFGVLVDRWMPANQIAVVDLSVCYPVFLEIPGKGLLFTEELSRTGSSRKFQLYGEVGLEYGAPTAHGLLKDLT